MVMIIVLGCRLVSVSARVDSVVQSQDQGEFRVGGVSMMVLVNVRIQCSRVKLSVKISLRLVSVSFMSILGHDQCEKSCYCQGNVQVEVSVRVMLMVSIRIRVMMSINVR